jgi:hypothetical protein
VDQGKDRITGFEEKIKELEYSVKDQKHMNGTCNIFEVLLKDQAYESWA